MSSEYLFYPAYIVRFVQWFALHRQHCLPQNSIPPVKEPALTLFQTPQSTISLWANISIERKRKTKSSASLYLSIIPLSMARAAKDVAPFLLANYTCCTTDR
jgi:hypothetical protein